MDSESIIPDNASRSIISLSSLHVFGCLLFFVIAGTYIRMMEPFYSYPYNNDEHLMLSIARGYSLREVLHFSLYDSHPPLFYILAHYWGMISGNPPFMRSMQLIFGVALIPLYYLIGNRINGPLCGLCCAFLVTFSFGGIVYSYMMRPYSLLVLILTLNFLCYLKWRENRSRLALTGYVITGWLAALSHFFSDFYFICLILFETSGLLWSEGWRRTIFEWIAANFCICLVFACLYYFWWPALSFFHAGNLYSPQLLLALTAPFIATDFIYPAPIPLLPFILLYAPLPAFASNARARLHIHFMLGGIACLVCMAIYMGEIYPWRGERQSLWMFPLLIPAAGGMMGDLLERLRISAGRFPLRIILGLMLLCAICDIGKRLVDEEYGSWMKGPVQEVTRILDQFGPRDILITDKDWLIELEKLQPYKTDENFMNTKTPVLVAYTNTHFLINSDYFGIYSPFAVRRMIELANSHHLLDNIDRIIIVKFWSKWPLYPLIVCDNLQKEIVYPPPAPFPMPLSTGELAVAVLSKKTFFDEVLSPGGSAQECLDKAQDTIPEYYYVPMSAKHNNYFKWDPVRRD